MTLEEELRALLNKHSAENGSNTPDYILASYLMNCLIAFNEAMLNREAWYGRRTTTPKVLTTDVTGPRPAQRPEGAI